MADDVTADIPDWSTYSLSVAISRRSKRRLDLNQTMPLRKDFSDPAICTDYVEQGVIYEQISVVVITILHRFSEN